MAGIVLKRVTLYFAFVSLCFASTAQAAVIAIGTNAKPIGTDYATMFKKMKANGMSRARTQVNLTWDTEPTVVNNFRAVVNAAKANGIILECVLMTAFGWGDRTDHGLYPKGDTAALYSQGYRRVYDFVSLFAKDVRDWELANEVNLLARDSSGQQLWGRGMTAAEFEQPLMKDWFAVLKGMSDAIEDINRVKGTHLRRIVGTTGSMFGYIDYMRSKGVKVDMIGYHYYEHAGVNPASYWLRDKPSFNLFAKLGSYGLPVTVNEMNCAEIYDSNFVNLNTSTTMATCNSNLKTMLQTWMAQKYANIESIILYEMFDEPAKSTPENRFGLMYNINSPKPTFNTVASFAKTLAQPSVSYVQPATIKNRVYTVLNPIVKGMIVGSYLDCKAVALPPGMVMNPMTCQIFGTPNAAAGTYTSTVTVRSINFVKNIAITVAP